MKALILVDGKITNSKQAIFDKDSLVVDSVKPCGATIAVATSFRSQNIFTAVDVISVTYPQNKG